MIKNYYNEKWVEIDLGYNSQLNYAISNYGRLASFTESIKTGRILNGSLIEGYRIFRYRFFEGKIILRRHLFYHRMVADNFLTKETDDQVFVLHLDYDKENNRVENLQWATKDEMYAHQLKNPAVIKNFERSRDHNTRRNNQKLTVSSVIRIKQLIHDPERKTRMKMIAKQFGISEMQLCRIKRGENWGTVKVPEVLPVRDKESSEIFTN